MKKFYHGAIKRMIFQKLMGLVLRSALFLCILSLLGSCRRREKSLVVIWDL